MGKEPNYSKREQDTFRATMISEMNKQNAMLNKIFEQSSKINIRVTKLEDKTDDYHDTKAQLNDVSIWKKEFMAEIKGMRRIIILVIIILPTLISTIFILYINNLRESIIKDSSTAVISLIEEKYHVEITK